MGSSPIQFSRPPIIEAVIGIDVEPLPENAITELRMMGEQIHDLYSQVHDLSVAHFRGEFSPQGAKSTARQSPIGLQFRSGDLTQVVQLRLNGFSFHRLPPYQNWESFRSEARRLWSLYRRAIGPSRVNTFFLRYINKLEVPALSRMEDSLRVYPEIPREIPQLLNNFLLRVELSMPGGGILVIHQTLVPSESPENACVLLDLELRFSGLGLSDEDVWNRIEAARQTKDDYFVACLTDQMKGRIS